MKFQKWEKPRKTYTCYGRVNRAARASQFLFYVHPSFEGYHYLIASYIDNEFCIFPSDCDGNVLRWEELNTIESRYDDVTFEEYMELQGFQDSGG